MAVETRYPIATHYLAKVAELVEKQGAISPFLNETAKRIAHESRMVSTGDTGNAIETIFKLWGDATRALNSGQELTRSNAVAQRYVRRYTGIVLQELGHTLPQTNTKRFFGRFF